MADGFSHRNVTLGIELYFDDVERAAAYHSRPGRAGGWPTVVTPPGLGLGADVEGDCDGWRQCGQALEVSAAEKSAMSVRLQSDDFRWAERSNHYEVTRR
jgi:hypothetical protein